MRPDNRAFDQMRPMAIETDISSYAEGSCMVRFGNTHLICTASLEATVPRFLRNRNEGWVTAEYGMLPRSTHSRMMRRHAAESGRTKEIQRLIGRSLRAIIDRKAFPGWQIIVDCDVLQADAGTRMAAITGGYVALSHAARHLRDMGIVKKNPLSGLVAGVSCVLINGDIVLDPNYEEDSAADADANFVMTDAGKWVEIQLSGEGKTFLTATVQEMMSLAEKGLKEIFALQEEALNA